jgi:uncharacterized surface protein with fasciclin (FAS1) repeats
MLRKCRFRTSLIKDFSILIRSGIQNKLQQQAHSLHTKFSPLNIFLYFSFSKKQIMKIKLYKLFAASAILLATACGSNDANKTSDQAGGDLPKVDSTVGRVPDPAAPTIDVLTALQQNNQQAFVDLVAAVGLTDTLSKASNITIFAPGNQSIEMEGLMAKAKAGKTEDIKKIIFNHIVPQANLNSSMVGNGQELVAMSGKKLTITVKDGQASINGIAITGYDRKGKNGTAHGIAGIIK